MTASLQLDGEDGSGVWGNMQGMYREAVGSMQQLLRRPEDSMPVVTTAQAAVSPLGLYFPLATSNSIRAYRSVQAAWRAAIGDNSGLQ